MFTLLDRMVTRIIPPILLFLTSSKPAPTISLTDDHSAQITTHARMTTAQAPTEAPSTTMSDTEAQLRQDNQNAFSRDLEFLSSLANPYYLNHLALSGVLSSPAFLRYLKHLDYFRHPKFVKYLQYPQALHFLDLLQSEEEFRLACRDPAFVGEVMQRQIGHWATWRNPEAGAEDEQGEAEVQGGLNAG